MTKDNPVAEGVAELLPCPFCGPGQSQVGLWHDDVARRWRVGCGRCGCSTGISPRDRTEEPAIAAWNRRAASPVQAGIDPLVAEIEAGLEGLPASAWRTETAWPADYAGYVVCGFFGETPHMPRLPQAQAFVVTDGDFDDDLNEAMARHVARCSPDNIAKLIAGYRSQAERIATLLAANDPSEREAQAIMDEAAAIERLDAAIDDYNTERNLRIAAESLLAEAREALEPFAAAYDRCAPEPHEIEMYGAAHPDSMADDKLAMTFPTIGDLRRARATLSRLKPGEKGGADE